jgi:hypothetical protein
MGIFGDLDIASAADNPNEIPPNTYYCSIFRVTTAPTRDGAKLGMTITYKILDGDYKDKQFTEWKEIPQPVDPRNPTKDEERAMSFIKTRLISFGIPADQMNNLKPDDLLGIEVDVSTVENPKNPLYPQVRRVSLHEGNVRFT